MSGTGYFTIEAQSYGIVIDVGASHNFWVLRDPDGNILGELHGMATHINPETGQREIEKVGFFDELGFYNLTNTLMQLNHRDSSVVYQGLEDDVKARWNAAITAADYFNNLHIPYNLLGIINPNSNSAFHIFGEIMGIKPNDFPWVWEPGFDKDLQYILNNYTLGHAASQNLGNTNKILVGNGGIDTLHGETGNDYLAGNGGDDVLIGDQGNDSLIGGDGNDDLFGGVGDDLLIGGKGSDTLNGAEGFDSYIYYSGDGFDAKADILFSFKLFKIKRIHQITHTGAHPWQRF